MYGYIILFLMFIVFAVWVYSEIKKRLLIKRLNNKEQANNLKKEINKNKPSKVINIILIVIAILSVIEILFLAVVAFFSIFTMFGVMYYEAGGDVSTYTKTINFANNSMLIFPILFMLVICLLFVKYTYINNELCKKINNEYQPNDNNQNIE